MLKCSAIDILKNYKVYFVAFYSWVISKSKKTNHLYVAGKAIFMLSECFTLHFLNIFATGTKTIGKFYKTTTCTKYLHMQSFYKLIMSIFPPLL